jgi:hypothetical protein
MTPSVAEPKTAAGRMVASSDECFSKALAGLHRVAEVTNGQ